MLSGIKHHRKIFSSDVVSHWECWLKMSFIVLHFPLYLNVIFPFLVWGMLCFSCKLCLLKIFSILLWPPVSSKTSLADIQGFMVSVLCAYIATDPVSSLPLFSLCLIFFLPILILFNLNIWCIILNYNKPYIEQSVELKKVIYHIFLKNYSNKKKYT